MRLDQFSTPPPPPLFAPRPNVDEEEHEVGRLAEDRLQYGTHLCDDDMGPRWFSFADPA